MGYRDQTPPTTPERVRSEAQQTERDQRVLESPECHRTPHHVWMARSGVSIAPMPPPVFVPPTIVPPLLLFMAIWIHVWHSSMLLYQIYTQEDNPSSPLHLCPPQLAPAPGQCSNISDLAQRYVALPPLIYPRGRQPSIAPVPTTQLAPAFVPAPAAQYTNIPDLTQQYAALPPLIECGRGRGRQVIEHGMGRGRGNNTTVSAPPMSYTELAARYAALPSVCHMFYSICRDKTDFCTSH